MKIYSKYHNVLIFIFFVILTGISLMDFNNSLKKDYFFRYKFDLEETKVIEDLGDVEFIEIKHNTLKLIKPNDFTLEKLKTYQATSLKGDSQFRFVFWQKENQNEIIELKEIAWYFTVPVESKGKFKLEEIELKRKDKGKVSVQMFVDDLGCCFTQGKKMRYHMNKVNPNLLFEGNSKDIYGYSYSGGNYLKSPDFVDIVKKAIKTDYVILWFGRNNTNISKEKTVEDFRKIIDHLEGFQKTKIILLTPAPSPVKEYDIKIEAIVNALKNMENRNLEIIDVHNLIKQQKNWKDEMFYSDYALSDKAYKIIIDTLDAKF